MMWTFELFRILTAQRLAEQYREVDRARLAEQMTPDGLPRKAAPLDGDRSHGPADFHAPIRHAG